MKYPEVKQDVWGGVGGLKEKDVDENCVVQIKYDGSCYVLHLWNGVAFALTSKRVSKKTNLLSEKIDHFKDLKGTRFLVDSKWYSRFVCEVSADHLKTYFDDGALLNGKGEPYTWAKRSNYVAGVMNSSIDASFNYDHKLKLICFDVMEVSGKSYADKPYNVVYGNIKALFPSAGEYGENVSSTQKTLVYSVKNLSHDIADFNHAENICEDVIKKGYEGIVVKDAISGKSLKLKGFLECDCIVIGFKEGTNKYAANGWIGSIKLGVLRKGLKLLNGVFKYKEISKMIDSGDIIDVGFISGMDEELRAKISANKSKYLGQIVNVEYVNWTGKKMRHPRIGEKGFRTDQTVNRCSIEQFVKEE